MINGSLAPKIDNIFFPEYRTSVKTEYFFDSKSNKSITKRKHIEFFYQQNDYTKYEIVYTVTITHPTKQEFDLLRVLDGKECRFWPHSDSGVSYISNVSIVTANLNNKSFIDQITLKITTLKTIAPMMIMSTVPANNSSGVSFTDDFIITFDKQLNTDSCYNVVTVRDMTTGNLVQCNSSGYLNTIRVTHGRLNEFTIYEIIVLPVVESVNGDRLRGRYRFSFTTKKYDTSSLLYLVEKEENEFKIIDNGFAYNTQIPNPTSAIFGDYGNWVSNDTGKLTIASTLPASGAVNIGISGDFYFTASNELLRESVNKETVLLYNGSGKYFEVKNISVTGKEVRFSFSDLDSNAQYTVKIKRLIFDIYKELIDKEYLITFTTAKELPINSKSIFIADSVSSRVSSIEANSMAFESGVTIGAGFGNTLANNNNSAIMAHSSRRLFITYISPNDNADYCELNQSVMIIFNTKINQASVLPTTCKIMLNSVSIPTTITKGENFIKLTPTGNLLNDSMYQVSVSGVTEDYYLTAMESPVLISFKTKQKDSMNIWFTNGFNPDSISIIETIAMTRSSIAAGGSGGSIISTDNYNNAIIANRTESLSINNVSVSGKTILGPTVSFVITFNEILNSASVGIASVKLFNSKSEPITITAVALYNYITVTTGSLFEDAYSLKILSSVSAVNGVSLGTDKDYSFTVFNYTKALNDIFYLQQGMINYIDTTDFRRSIFTTNELIIKSFAPNGFGDLFVNVGMFIDKPGLSMSDGKITMTSTSESIRYSFDKYIEPKDPDLNSTLYTGPFNAEIGFYKAISVIGDECSMVAELSNSWSPAEYNTALWLDAYDEKTFLRTEDGSILQWASKSPFGRIANSVSATKPKLVNNRVCFRGSEYMATTDPLSEGSSFLMFIVSRNGGVGRGLDGYGPGWSIHGSHIVLTSPSAVAHEIPATGNRTSVEIRTIHVSQPFTTADISGGYNGSYSSVIKEASKLRNSTIGMVIGKTTNDSTYVNCDICEIIIIDNWVIGTSIVQKFEGYLARKWDGINGNTAINDAMPDSHPYKIKVSKPTIQKFNDFIIMGFEYVSAPAITKIGNMIEMV